MYTHTLESPCFSYGEYVKMTKEREHPLKKFERKNKNTSNIPNKFIWESDDLVRVDKKDEVTKEGRTNGNKSH